MKNESTLRTVVLVVLSLAGFPIVWPAHVIRSAVFGRRHRVRMARMGKPKDAGKALAQVRAKTVRSAVISTRTTPSMASGADEEVCVELFMDDGSIVVASSEALLAALKESEVPVREEESQAHGIGTIFAWGLWLVSLLALGAIFTNSIFLGVAAAVVIAALIAFALS